MCFSSVIRRKLTVVTLSINEPYIQLSHLLGCEVFDLEPVLIHLNIPTALESISAEETWAEVSQVPKDEAKSS